MAVGKEQRSNVLPLALTIAGLVLLSISPGYTQGENHINLLLCGVMCLSPLVLLLRGARVFIPRVDIPLMLTCLLIFATPLLFHPETIRLTTMLFTCAYCVYMMMLARLLRISDLRPETLLKVIRMLVYAFAAVLVIQQICVLAGWPVFCAGMVYEDKPFKLNSLTAEPSHTSIILCSLMFFYTQTCRVVYPRKSLWTLFKDRWPMWICLVWTLFSTRNATAVLFFPLIFLPFITRRNVGWVICAAALIIVGLFCTPIGEQREIKRAKDTVAATLTFDEVKIGDADISAAYRIVPSIVGAKAVWPFDRQTFTGHGVDADSRDLESRPTDPEERGCAGLFGVWYNYGLICAFALWWAMAAMTILPRRPLTFVTFLLALQMSVDYNMQLLWLLLAYGMVFKYAVCDDRKLLKAKSLSASGQ